MVLYGGSWTYEQYICIYAVATFSILNNIFRRHFLYFISKISYFIELFILSTPANILFEYNSRAYAYLYFKYISLQTNCCVLYKIFVAFFFSFLSINWSIYVTIVMHTTHIDTTSMWWRALMITRTYLHIASFSL